MVSYYLLEYNFFFAFACYLRVLCANGTSYSIESDLSSIRKWIFFEGMIWWKIRNLEDFVFFFLQRFNEIVKKFLFNISIEYNRNILSEGCTWLLSKLRRKYENVFKLRASLESRLPRPVEIKCRIPFGLQRVK